jgi:hypothetical protein
MFETETGWAGTDGEVQATALALLVECEACWENLRHGPPAGATEPGLRGRQRAYDAFHGRLVAYNRRYAPAHVPELLLNTPARLGKWCRAMRDLHLRAEQSGSVPCPVELLEKAYRWADRIGLRMNPGRGGRAGPPTTLQEAIRDLESLGRRCDDLIGARPTAAPVAPD